MKRTGGMDLEGRMEGSVEEGRERPGGMDLKARSEKGRKGLGWREGGKELGEGGNRDLIGRME